MLFYIDIETVRWTLATYSADEVSMYGYNVRSYKRKRIRRTLPTRLLAAMLGLTLGAILSLIVTNDFKKIKPEVTVETGSFINRADFFSGELNKATVLTDLSKINMDVPGTYQIAISLYGRKVNSILQVRDTTPPTGKPVPQSVFVNKAPDPNDTVKDLYDASGTVYVEYAGTPDLSVAGDTEIPVKLTDAYGNSSIVKVPFNIYTDTTPPFIDGAVNLTIIQDDPLTLMKNLKVTDDYTENPEVTVDASGLDSSKPGTYQIVYYATDEIGNRSAVPISVTVVKRPDNYYYPEDVYKLAQPIYDKIIDRDDYTDVEIAMRIFKWCDDNITYVKTSNKSHWTGAAVQGFNTLHGDCYNTYACAKALLDIAGIENKYVYGQKKYWHCWNLVKLNGQWYNCDATKTRAHRTYWFMRCDYEMDPKFPIKTLGLPDRATKSVQKKLDFTNLTMKQ